MYKEASLSYISTPAPIQSRSSFVFHDIRLGILPMCKIQVISLAIRTESEPDQASGGDYDGFANFRGIVWVDEEGQCNYDVETEQLLSLAIPRASGV